MSAENIKEKPSPEVLSLIIFENGISGERVEELVSASSFEKSGVRGALEGYLERLKERESQIPQKLQTLPRRKHGGRPYSRVELAQIREGLGGEEASLSAEIEGMGASIRQVGGLLKLSSLLGPLAIEVGRKIKIREGVLSESDRVFWRFVESKAPEVWRLLEEEKIEEFRALYQLFGARLRLSQPLPEKEYSQAQRELSNLITQLGRSTELDETSVIPVFRKITAYFAGDSRGKMRRT